MKSFLPLILLTAFISTTLCRAQTPLLWGMTSSGGAYNGGTIFSYDISTSTFTPRYSFGDGGDGRRPVASLMRASNGLLYGMTNGGGANGTGAIFSFNTTTGVETVVHSFTEWGYGPWGSLIQVGDSTLYGMTTFGGAGVDSTNGGGTIFRYNIYNGDFLYVHDFGNGIDGMTPYGSLLQLSNGLLYGTTNSGNLFDFDYTLTTGADSTKFAFGLDSSYGLKPYSTLIQASNGLLYGTTLYGGNRGEDSLYIAGLGPFYINGGGTLFSYNAANNKLKVLNNFANNTTGGILPYGSLLQVDDSTLYGMTLGSAWPNDTVNIISGNPTTQGGTIYSFDIYNNATSILYQFGHGHDGQSPYGALMQAYDGLLYGMTFGGGVGDSGTIFSYNMGTNTETVLHSFSGTDGANPYGDLLEVDFPSAIKQLSAAESNLHIFPNPSNGEFMIELPGKQASYPAEVYSTLGQKMGQFTLTGTQNTINLSNQPGGMYYIYLITETGAATGKVVIERQ